MNKTIYLTLQNSIRQVLAMLLFVILARYLSVDDFGKYQQLLLVVGIFGVIFSMGIPVAISYFHGQANSFSKKVSVYKRFFISQLLLVLLGVILFYFSSGILAKEFKNEYFNTFVVLLSILIVTNTSLELFKNLSTVTNNLKNYLIITSTIQLISIFVNILIVINTQEIFWVLFTTAFFNTLVFIYLIKQNLKYFLVKNSKKIISKTESKYILAMGSVALVSVFNGYMDQIMVSMMLSIKEYSNLKIGAFQIPFIGIVTGSLLTVMIPIISNHYRKKEYDAIVDIWKLSIEKASILLVPIVIFCLVFANEIITSFFGDKFIGAVIIFQVYMFQWLRAVVIFGGVMGAIGLEKELFRNTVLITILNIVLNYILILEFGVIGAAIATTLLNFLGGYLLIGKVNNKLNRNFFSYFPYKIYFISLLLSLVVSLSLLLILENYLLTIWSIVLLALVFYVVIISLQMKIFYKEVSYKKLRELI